MVTDMFARFDYRRYFALEPKAKLNFILDAANHIAELSEVKEGKSVRSGKERLKENVIRLENCQVRKFDRVLANPPFSQNYSQQTVLDIQRSIE